MSLPQSIRPRRPRRRRARLLALSALLVAALVASYARAQRKPANEAPASKSPAEKKGGSTKNKRVAAISGVATYSSKNFVVNTDLPADEAQGLLKRLETMLSLISKYWARPLSGRIEMYVVKQLRNWPAGSLPSDGVAAIESGGGVTISESVTLGNAFRAKSIVYAIAYRGTPQHEAVHAYCWHTFGRTGPVWYSEGMAEMGQYWRADDFSVNADDGVIRYLRSTEVKDLIEIVNGVEWTGDSWENYAWRWALCHLLSNNTNYAARFRPLGLGLLLKQDVSFEKTYGDMAKEISFEYREFIRHLERGYRADLCSWDWKAKFKPVRTSAVTTCRVDAGKGWQPSRLGLVKGDEYEFSVSGKWTTSKDGATVTAQGAENGSGRLIGAVLRDENGAYVLDDPFELGAFGAFVAPGEGNLYLRCRDDWVGLADNKGVAVVKLKLKGKGKSLAAPDDDGDRRSPDESESDASAN